MESKEEYKESKVIEDTHYVCAICDDEPEYCHECDKSFNTKSKFYCDNFGEHLCLRCYNKKQREKVKNGR